MPNFFPWLLIACSVGASVTYFVQQDIRMGIYWLAAATLNVCVTISAAGAMIQWRPIETAPKDGTTILVYLENEIPKIKSVFFDEDNRGRGNWVYNAVGHRGVYIKHDTILYNPTHWAPVPDPP